MNSYAQPDKWLSNRSPNPQAQLRLFCFPFAGGGASIYRQWPALLPRIDVLPIQLPGRENRFGEPFFKRMPALIQATMQGIAPFLDKPFAFFGYSLGGLVAYELALALMLTYQPQPQHLIVAGCAAPSVPPRREPVHQLSDEAFIAEIKEMNGTPEAILADRELLALLLPVMRADFELYETVQRRQSLLPLDCAITAVSGEEDEIACSEDMQPWRAHTSQSFAHHQLPGGHFFINTAQQQLIDLVQQALQPAL